MMKKNMARVGVLGTVALGLMSALTAGCASDATSPAGSSEPTGTQSSAWGITPLGWTVNGCSATGMFNIQSPQTIQFVAMNQANLANANMQLYNVDDMGRQTAINQTAQQASQSMQSLLNSVTSASQLAQFANQQAAQAASNASTATMQNYAEADQTVVASQGSATDVANMAATHTDIHDQASNVNGVASASNFSSASGTNNAANSAQSAAAQNATAATNAAGSNSALTNANQFANNGGNTAFNSFVPFVAGGIGILPTSQFTSFNNFTNAGNNANQAAAFQNAAATQQAAAQNAAQAAQSHNSFANAAQNAANQVTNTSTAAHVANQTADTSHVDSSKAFQNTQSVAHSQNIANSAAAQQAAAQSSAASASGSNLAQQTASNFNSQSAASQFQSSAQVFNDLSTLNSHHLILQVNATSNQANSVMQLFTGNNGTIQSWSNFGVATPGCGVGVGAVGVGAVGVGAVGVAGGVVNMPAPERVLEAAKEEQ